MRVFHNVKTYQKRETSHCKDIRSYEPWIKKLMHEKISEPNERKKSSKKKCTLLHFLLVILSVAQGTFRS